MKKEREGVEREPGPDGINAQEVQAVECLHSAYNRPGTPSAPSISGHFLDALFFISTLFCLPYSCLPLLRGKDQGQKVHSKGPD